MTATRRHWASGHPRRVDRRLDLHVGGGDRKLLHDRSTARVARERGVRRGGRSARRASRRAICCAICRPELNRLYFQLWNGAQIVLGVLALLAALGSTAQPLGRDR